MEIRMGENDVVQIRVGGYSVGIVGLAEAMEDAASRMPGASDEALGVALLERLSRRNYIPNKAQETYKVAFVREFKKFIGKPFEESNGTTGLVVKVLGMGCVQCDRLEQEVISAMAQTGLAGDVEHVRDPKRIGEYGVMGSPALIINGQVKSVGKVPPRMRIVEWLREAAGGKTQG
jgi:hypothetical protein